MIFFKMLFFILFFFLFCSSFGKKPKQTTIQNRTEAPVQLSGTLQISLCIQFGYSVLHFECRAHQYFARVTLLLFREAACQSQCFVSIFQSDSRARVMESIFHQTGSSFSFLSAAQPRAAEDDQASLVNEFNLAWRKGFWASRRYPPSKRWGGVGGTSSRRGCKLHFCSHSRSLVVLGKVLSLWLHGLYSSFTVHLWDSRFCRWSSAALGRVSFFFSCSFFPCFLLLSGLKLSVG